MLKQNVRYLSVCVSKTAEVKFEFITRHFSEATANFGSGQPNFSLFVDMKMICK